MASNHMNNTKELSIEGPVEGNTTIVDRMTSRDFHYDKKAHIEIMRESFRDQTTITTFKQAILHNKHLFRNRIVLNLNCSLGLYALFAAKAGAAKVYAIDNSCILDYTQRVVQANGYADVITIIKGNIQDVKLPEQQVDIIISEWMGYALLYESTCTDVIYARDKWLKKPNGLIFPDVAKLYVAAVQDESSKSNSIDWWRFVYGFKMNCIREGVLKESKCRTISAKKVLAEDYLIKEINLYTATYNDLNFSSKYLFHIARNGEMDGIALYFNVEFTKCHLPMSLNTDPWSPRTRWLQTICYFDEHVQVYPEQIYFGGIEFQTLAQHGRKIPNLNDIKINFEMLYREQNGFCTKTQMSWCLK